MIAPVTTHEVETALDRQAMRARRVVLISPPSARKRGRCVYRVDLADGRTIKARWLESAEAASRLCALRADLEEAFSPVIAQDEALLLEAWIEGTLLTALDPAAHAAESGALLGRLHARESAGAPATVDTGPWRDRAAAELAILADAGALASAAIAKLGAELRRTDPGTARTSLVHNDFCAENMLIDGGGRLRVIDNEWLSIAPSGFDLGRTFSRWPMSDQTWWRFLAAYRSAARVDPGPLAFWKIATALTSACIRLPQGGERLEVPLGMLRRVAERPETALCDPP